MKWVFLSLLAINVVLVAIQWVDSRGTVTPVPYIDEAESKQLKLLAEISGEKFLVGKEAELCLLVGPLDSRNIAEEMRESLNEGSENAKLVVQEVKKAPSYWVYFDDYENKSASTWFEEFQLKKIDTYVINIGNLKGALSLGVFENIDLAYRLKKLMKKKGYESKISEINKVDKEFWLLFSSGYAAENQKKIDEMLTPLKKMHEKREISCKSVASEK